VDLAASAYRSDELVAWACDNRWKPLCDFDVSPASSALDWLIQEMNERRRARDLPVISEPAWRAKAKKSRIKHARGDWLIRLCRKLLKAMI
jgi:hypothetical protein